MRRSHLARELVMVLVAPGVAVGLLWALEQPDVRWRLRENPWTAPRHLRECRRNLDQVGGALEMYSTDWSGRYPPSLAHLPPNYLKALPTCPAREADTYRYERDQNPDTYTLVCRGRNHPGSGVDQPVHGSWHGVGILK